MVVATPPDTLDPRFAVDVVSHRLSRLLHAGLTEPDSESLAPRPRIARELRWESPTELYVRIHEGLRFASGAPLEAADVAATLAAYKNGGASPRASRVVEPVEAVETLSPTELRIRLRAPHASLLSDLELPIVRRDEATSPARSDGSLDGLGTFRVLQFGAQGRSVVFGPVAGGCEVHVQTVSDENARALRFLGGKADLGVSVFSPTLLPALSDAPALRVTSRRAASVTYVVMRVDEGPLSDLPLRRRLRALLHPEALTATLFANTATVATTMLPPAHWVHAEPAGANDAHATAAPAPTTPSSVAEESDAAPVRLPNRALRWLTSPDRFRVTLARTLAQSVSDGGIAVDVVPLEFGTLLARLGSGDFDLAMLSLPELGDPHVLSVFLHSTSIPPNGANRGRVRDGVLDELFDRGDQTVDPRERARIYRAVEARIHQQAWLVPVFHEDFVTVGSDRVSGFAPSADGRWGALERITRPPSAIRLSP
jgi:peptide/nickel transport system substrate-binding protein